MKTKLTAARLRSVIASQGFFKFIVGLLVVQAAWIALSGRYPMAFDEDFHLGIIRLYAHHLSPFWSSQPAGANVFGAVARDPSYLYQYLMSFPYRLIELFTHDQNIQVVILRFIDIGLFASGLVAMRRLFLKTGASRAIINVCLLLFVLIPVVSQLAAQINYDDLLLPLTGWALAMAIDVGQHITKRQLDLKHVLGLLILCLLASLVKYAFLPIFLAIVVYLLVMVFRTYRPAGKSRLLSDLVTGWRGLGRRNALILIAGLILSLGLFSERYAINLIHYHTPVPDCSKVLNVQQCSAYGPWIRDYNYKISKVDEDKNPFVFTADWFYGMWLRLFFAVDGPATQFQTRGPLPVPAIATIVFTGFGLIVFVAFVKKVYRRYNQPALWLLTIASVLYLVALWLDEFKAFISTGQPVAINGRYLFPVLLPIMMLVALAYKEWLAKRPNYQVLVAAVAVLAMLWGGGALTYILRSNDQWYWNSALVRDANHAVQATLGPATPGYYVPTQFLR